MTLPLIDADTHVIEDDHCWETMTGADAAHRPVAVTAGKGAGRADNFLAKGFTGKAMPGGGVTFWLIDGQLYPRGGQMLIDYPDGARDLRNPKLRIAAMDALGIDRQVIYSSLFSTLRTKNPAVELAIARGYNRWLAGVSAASGGRFQWVAIPSAQNIAASVADLDEWIRLGACGVALRGFEGEETLDQPEFFPLYKRASDLGLPLCIHIGHASKGWGNILGAGNALGLLVPNLVSFMGLIFSDVAAKFPDLKIGFIESGAAWLPFVLSRAARFAARYGVAPQAERLLSEKRLFVTCEFHEDIAGIAKVVGDDCLMIGTDYGHSDTSTELNAPVLLEARDDLPAALRRKIVRENPGAFYRA